MDPINAAHSSLEPTNQPQHTHRAPDASLDLRRSVPRPLAELLVDRADYIQASERALIREVYGRGKPLGEVARLRRQSPRVLRREVRDIARRMLNPAFAFVLGRCANWTPTMRAVARETIVHGRPLRQVARDLGISYHSARRHAQALRTLLESSDASSRQPLDVPPQLSDLVAP